MATKILKNKITRKKLEEMAKSQFGDLVKAVVDVRQEIMAIGGELHADEEVFLNEQIGSNREDTWGINIYPQRHGDEMIEFDSMINLKPQYSNRSRRVESEEVKDKIIAIVKKLIIK